MRMRASILWIFLFFFFPEAGFPQPPVPNPLGLRTGTYQISQGWVLAPVDLDLFPGYTLPPSTSTFLLQGGGEEGLAFGGGVNTGGLRLSLYGVGTLDSSEGERRKLRLDQTFTGSGIAQTLQKETIPLSYDSLRQGGIRFGIATGGWGGGLSYRYLDRRSSPSSLHFVFPDTEITAVPGEWMAWISSPTEGQIQLSTRSRWEDRERMVGIGIDGGGDLGSLFLYGSAILLRTLTSSEGEIANDPQGYQVKGQNRREDEDIFLQFLFGSPPRREKGWVWAVGGGTLVPLTYSFQEGSFYDGRVPPAIEVEWSRERELLSRKKRELSALALLGYYDYQEDEEAGGGISISYLDAGEDLSLRERLRLRQLSERGGGFGQGEGGGVWQERARARIFEISFSAGMRREILSRIKVVGGGAIRYREEVTAHDLNPQELRPVTGTMEISPGVLDPLFFPYTPHTLDLGEERMQRGILLELGGGIEITMGEGTMGFYLLHKKEGSGILFSVTLLDL
jgi:hypothetical protein